MPTFPSPSLLQNVKVTTWSPTLVSQAHNLNRQARSKGAHRWLIEAELPDNLTRAEAATIFAFITALRGQYLVFDITPPVISNAQGAGGGTPLVNGASQTGRAVVTDGWPASTTVLLAGDFLTFYGHYKVYMATSNVATDAAGNATINIEPALFASPADNAPITINGVSWRVAMMEDRYSLDLAPVLFAVDKLSLIETPNG